MIEPSAESSASRRGTLHLVSSFRWTGAAEPATQLAQAQRSLGRESSVALQPGGSFAKRAASMDLPVVDGILKRRAGPLSLLKGRKRLREAAGDFDAIHCHLTADHWLAGLALAGRRSTAGGPLLLRTFHREEIPRRDAASRWLARRTDGLIAISSSLAGRLRDAYDLPAERVLVAGGAVDAEAFSPGGDGARMREAWGVPADVPLAGLLSRVREARGVFTLLDAAEPLSRLLPDAHLIFCGRGRHADRLRDAIKNHPLRDRVHFPGYVQPADLRDAYAAFDVAVQLAPGNDGTCRAALQAMACGCPLVAARTGALADLLSEEPGGRERDPREGGKLVAPNSPEELAQALALFLGDKDLRAEAGHAARKLMSTRHRPEDHARKVLEFQDGLKEGVAK